MANLSLFVVFVESFEPDSGVGGGELPADFGLGFVAAAGLPGSGFMFEFLAVGDAAVENAQFDLHRVQRMATALATISFEEWTDRSTERTGIGLKTLEVKQ